MGKIKKARSGKWFCVMLTLQLAFAVALLGYLITKLFEPTPDRLGAQIVLSMFLEGPLGIVFMIFTIINFSLSFRFRNAGGNIIRLLSIFVFILSLALTIALVIFAIFPFVCFIMFGWIIALAQHNNNVNFIETLFMNRTGTWITIALVSACVVLLIIMVVIAWMKLRTIPPTLAVSK